jgi:hypothetical protein
MKNIHVLPTDKPSEFYSIDGKHKLANNTMAMDWYISSVGYKPHNIYITDDSEIKEGDWILDTVNDIIEKVKFISKGKLINGCWVLKSCKKIILTTDQDLIKDGVQAINDEFLEWFVKNPSCEEVEVESNKCLVKRGQCSCSYQDIDCQCSGYQIIIPQEKICSFCDGTGQVVSSTTISRFKTCDCKMIPKEEPKQETLEEFAERLCPNKQVEYDMILEGAKWQAERMYSEEEIILSMKNSYGFKYFSEKKFLQNLEQFKKK